MNEPTVKLRDLINLPTLAEYVIKRWPSHGDSVVEMADAIIDRRAENAGSKK